MESKESVENLKSNIKDFIEMLKPRYSASGGVLEFVDAGKDSVKLKFFTPSKEIFAIGGKKKSFSDITKEEIEKKVKSKFQNIKTIEFE